MKFSELLLVAIRQSEIPLRFEPGAEDAIVQPVVEVLKAWVESHEPVSPTSDFDYGRKAVVHELLEELGDQRDLPE